MQRILEEAGYQTMVATNGAEAIEQFTERGGCDLLVTDLIMPEVTGDEVARRVRGTARPFSRSPVR